jgi:hypothetical protein
MAHDPILLESSTLSPLGRSRTTARTGAPVAGCGAIETRPGVRGRPSVPASNTDVGGPCLVAAVAMIGTYAAAHVAADAGRVSASAMNGARASLER